MLAQTRYCGTTSVLQDQDFPVSKDIVYVTGDTHGRFGRIRRFCHSNKTTLQNTLVILGDAGINYFDDDQDVCLKIMISRLPITLLCIHGNHEMRPCAALGYAQREYHGGKVWVQPEYPNILFAIDGEVYWFNQKSCISMGGAYSVDKDYRLANGWRWFPDEQPDEKIKSRVEAALAARNWKIDYVFSHTCPLEFEPTEEFLPTIDQSTVDKSTEKWLGSIEEKLDYRFWYCGHFHTEKTIEKIRFMYNDYSLIT